jgi:tetratricopeptide (TPR) repeat protein
LGKDRLLVPCRYSQGESLMVAHRLLGIISLGLFVTFSILGCSHLPKVRILHDPLTAQEHLALGISYESQGKTDKAISEYQAARKKNDKELGITPLAYLANAHAQRGEYQQASKYYRKALAWEPKNGQLLNNLAWIYLQQGNKLEEAERMVKQALGQSLSEHGPSARAQRAMYLDTLAEVKMVKGDYSEALTFLLEAEELADQSDALFLSHLYSNQSQAYEALGQAGKAKDARVKSEMYSSE